MLEVTVRCGCTRKMSPDGLAGPGLYRCGCGTRVALSGLPPVDDRRCAVPIGKRLCNAPKRPGDRACEPCSIWITKATLRDREAARQLGAEQGAIDFATAQREERERLLADYIEHTRIDRRPDMPQPGVVYYCELRPGLVKIGTTIQLVSRMSSLHIPVEAVLAAEPGHYALEKLRHRQFAAQRIGQREDFAVDELLQAHISKVADMHGDPFELATRLRLELEELAQDPTSELACANVVTAR